MDTYTVAAAREDFTKILNLVVATGNPVSIVRYRKPMVDIVPSKMTVSPKKDWNAIASKYAGMWSGSGYEWVEDIGKSSRYFRKKNYWS